MANDLPRIFDQFDDNDNLNSTYAEGNVLGNDLADERDFIAFSNHSAANYNIVQPSAPANESLDMSGAPIQYPYLGSPNYNNGNYNNYNNNNNDNNNNNNNNNNIYNAQMTMTMNDSYYSNILLNNNNNNSNSNNNAIQKPAASSQGHYEKPSEAPIAFYFGSDLDINQRRNDFNRSDDIPLPAFSSPLLTKSREQ
ncbi:hypothetical protein RFI_18378, partial [Reticulomyxa filosa]